MDIRDEKGGNVSQKRRERSECQKWNNEKVERWTRGNEEAWKGRQGGLSGGKQEEIGRKKGRQGGKKK